MGVAERRARQKENLRQEILDAARQMFVEEGYASVSMRKIAERIEYSPTTIYLHFKDKAEIFHQLCEETFAKLTQRLETLARKHTDPIISLRAGMLAYVDFGLKNPHHYTITFIISPEQSGEYAFEDSIGARAFGVLRSAVEGCVTSGVFRSVDVDTAAQSLWAAIHGVTSLLIVHCDFPFVPKTRLIEHTIDTMIEGLRA
jgi:AcrR family transcriptional regulator